MRCRKKWQGEKSWAEPIATKLFIAKLSAETAADFMAEKSGIPQMNIRSVIFQCNLKFKNEDKCRTPKLTEDEIKQRFLTAYNELMGNRSTVLADCELIRQTLCDTTALDAEMQQEQDEMTVASELMKTHIKKNASVAQSQETYAQEAGRIEERYNAALEHHTALETEREKRIRKSKELTSFIAMLKKQPLAISEWDERLWITLLDTATDSAGQQNCISIQERA